VLGKSWRGGPCIYWTSSPCRRSTDSATTAVSSARRHLECPETSRRCSRNVSFYTNIHLYTEHILKVTVRSPSDGAIKKLTDQVRMTVVPGIFLDHVDVDPSQRARLPAP